MVFFTCTACGESLKKAQVEKHTASCRNCKCLSCIDCGKDFWGEEYKSHLKCITEDQKYGGKGFEAKAHKGDVKQQRWLQRISEAMKRPNINPKLKNILNQLGAYENIPRKKAKFQNWMKNSIKIFDQTLQDQVWEIVSQATDSESKAASNDAPKPSDTESKSDAAATTEETEKKKSKRERKEERQAKNKKEKKELNSEEPAENGTKKKGKKRKAEDQSKGNDEEETTEEVSTEKMKKKKKKQNEEQVPQKKREHDDSEEETGEDPAEAEEDSTRKGKSKFNWKGTIKALLKDAPDNELPVKKLRKKVIAQYYATSSDQHKSEEEILSTFNKKIQNNPKFRLLKEKVKLIK